MPDDAPLLLDVTRLIWRRWKGRHPTGVDRVCLAYLRHFGPSSQAVVQHKRFRRILGRKASQELFALLEGPANRFRAKLPFGTLRHLGRLNESGRGRLYLNVGHTGLDSAGFRDWVAPSQVKPVYLVHDLIPITHPMFCRAGEADRHRERMRTILKTAVGVIGNSQATLGALSEFARSEGEAQPPSLAAWLGTDTLHVPAVQTPERATFITIGTIEARKNHLLLLDIWSRLIDEFGTAAPQLLIVGQRGWEAEPVFDRLDRDEKLRGHVIELNHCSDEGVARNLLASRALLFPSFAEGYGLPLIEALGAGVPVIASDLPVFREIGCGIPNFLGPSDHSAWEDAIRDFTRQDSSARAAQLARIKKFRAPDWQVHFRRVEAWLQKL